VRGIGEAFTTNPATGTGALSVPLAASPGRGGVTPPLTLGYDSGLGNGPFGLGFALTLGSIARKTDKGLPRYDDTGESDVFVLAGGEDLVPALHRDEGGNWVRDTRPASEHDVQRFRPRVEGDHARIERWRRRADGDVHWRVTTRDNVTSLYGYSREARIADPSHHERVFTWLLERVEDARGQVTSYLYKEEDTLGVDASALHERARLSGLAPTANRYPKRIRYGNRVPHTPVPDPPVADPVTGLPADAEEWLFEVVFDYGEHGQGPAEERPWPVRADPFSSCRAGFEMRTWRLCRRVLVFHRVADPTRPELVRSTTLGWDERPTLTRLVSVVQNGHRTDPSSGAVETLSLPPLEMEWTEPVLDETVQTADVGTLDNLPAALETEGAHFVDLDGEGVSGVLLEADGGWWYKRSLGGAARPDGGHGPARFGPLEAVPVLPVGAALSPTQQLVDVDGDGRLDLLHLGEPASGFYAHAEDGRWEPFVTFESSPVVDWRDPNLRWVDLDGDGRPDILITQDDAFLWHRSRARLGFEAAEVVARPTDEEHGPALVFADGTDAIFLADMGGDGLQDLVRIRNGEVCYWPSLGHGRFGAKVTMTGSPWFDDVDQFDASRLRLADLDGTGPTDIVYLRRDGALLFFNESGNGFSAGQLLENLPPVTAHRSLVVADLLGRGTSCLVWSSAVPGDDARPLAYVDLMAAGKPHLLRSFRNQLGAETTLAWTTSTRFYLEDREAGRPWLTRLPFPVHVVESVERRDLVSGVRTVERFAWHHGYFDGVEREFRGFARVDRWDAEGVAALAPDGGPDAALPPVRTTTWLHNGAWAGGRDVAAALRQEWWTGDAEAPVLPDPGLPDDPGARLTGDDLREACRALRGRVLRTEVYAEDGGDRADAPYTVTAHVWQTRCLQPRQGTRSGVFDAWEAEVLTLDYERQAADPRVGQRLVLEVDEYGHVLQLADVAWPRRPGPGRLPAQARRWITWTVSRVANLVDRDDAWRLGAPVSSLVWDVTGIEPVGTRFTTEELRLILPGLPEVPYEAEAEATVAARRVIAEERTLYRADDLSGPRPLGVVEPLALVHERYERAFTPGRWAVYGSAVNAADVTTLRAEGGYVDLDGDGSAWIPSGRALLSPPPSPLPPAWTEDASFAAAHFYLPRAAVDPFGAITRLTWDALDLLAVLGEDAAGNVTFVRNDPQVLAPDQMTDANGNLTEIRFDALGRVVLLAVVGKPGETNPDLRGDSVDDPTVRFEYGTDEWWMSGRPTWVRHLSRERHADPATRWQEVWTFGDGFGREVQRKTPAEPGAVEGVHADPRWVGTGTVVFDGKGRPLRQYEPFFSTSSTFELKKHGVASTLFYDPPGRLVATLFPDHSWEKVVFDPWRRDHWDRNDTTAVADPRLDLDAGPHFRTIDPADLLPTWTASFLAGSPDEVAAANRALAYAGTPAVVHLDALGRAFRVVEDNGAQGSYATEAVLDVEGHARTVSDALERVVQRLEMDLVGRVLSGEHVDSGARLSFPDVGGTAIRTWDARGHRFRQTLDVLRRPLGRYVDDGTGERLLEHHVYGEGSTGDQAANRRGRAWRARNGAGEAVVVSYDLHGLAAEVERQVASDFQVRPDWSGPVDLEQEVWVTRTRYDALSRVIEATSPHTTEVPASIVTPTWNEASLLEHLEVRLRGEAVPTVFVENVDYDEHGLRLSVRRGNGSGTVYRRDPLTFRLRQLTTTRADGALLQDLSYTWDAVGNAISIRDGAQATVFFANQVVEAHADYTYDALYRLVEARGREHIGQAGGPLDWDDTPRTNRPLPGDGAAMRRYTERYAYDAAGNLLRLSHLANGSTWAQEYAYDEPVATARNNRLTSTTSGQTRSAYAWDAHGNLLSMPHLPALAWDALDRLERVDRGPSDRTWYAYDGGGERVRKVRDRDGAVEERLYLGGFEVFRRRVNGTLRLQRETLHVMDGEDRLALVETKTVDVDRAVGLPEQRTRYQHENHLGSAVLELDEAARVIGYEEYYPYGSTAYQSVPADAQVPAKRYRYTGQEKDDETGFTYHGARYYAPWLGRWTAVDPEGMVDGTNPYVYCRDQPVGLTDSTGTDCNPPPTRAQLDALTCRETDTPQDRKRQKEFIKRLYRDPEGVTRVLPEVSGPAYSQGVDPLTNPGYYIEYQGQKVFLTLDQWEYVTSLPNLPPEIEYAKITPNWSRDDIDRLDRLQRQAAAAASGPHASDPSLPAKAGESPKVVDKGAERDEARAKELNAIGAQALTKGGAPRTVTEAQTTSVTPALDKEGRSVSLVATTLRGVAREALIRALRPGEKLIDYEGGHAELQTYRFALNPSSGYTLQAPPRPSRPFCPSCAFWTTYLGFVAPPTARISPARGPSIPFTARSPRELAIMIPRDTFVRPPPRATTRINRGAK
jgi:RHS repeat-associated protein